jgi:type I restriction enzyme S subunit
MPEWRRISLAEVVGLKRGFDLPESGRSPGHYPVLGSSGISGWHDQAAVSGPGITIGRSGASIGVASYFDGACWPLNTTLFVEDFKGNDPRFIFYLLDGIDFRSFNSGSAQPSLNRNHIASIKVDIPQPGEQRAISTVLGTLDDKIAANDRIAATSDDLGSSFLDRMLSDDNDTSGTLLAAIASVNQRKASPVPGGYLRYLDISSVSPGRIDWPQRTRWSNAPSRARRGVSPGDTIWSTVRPGRRSCALIMAGDPELVVSTGFAVLTPVKVGPAFLYEVTKRDEFVQYLESVSDGSAYPAVSVDRFEQATVPLLSPAGLTKFEDFTMPLRQRVNAAQEESRNLAELRDTLQPRLLSGEIRVRDAEWIVGDAT